ncbi:MAG: Tab2/Atab2 family RNA-binding protein [Cyanobacteria bacterium P01_A01_bin.84]
MTIWQVDFYRRPQQNSKEEIFWELLICDSDLSFKYEATCLQSDVNSTWITNQLQQVFSKLPSVIQVFRPQSLNLIAQAGKNLGIKVEGTRRTKALKKWLKEKKYPTVLDKPPPMPLPENLWGEEWRFATINASDITDTFAERRIPVLEIPDFLLPINLGLASTTPIPGVVIFGGKGSMRLARWLEGINPVELNYIPGQPDGLVLEAGLIDRWIVATFEDEEVAIAGQKYQERKLESQGLHFLLVQPDDSGMTYSGFWLLKMAE